MRIGPILAAGALICAAGTAQAQQVTVRSGEHDGFSRLVFMLPPGTDWQLSEGVGALTLRTPGESFGYDTAGVFRLIPRTRITGVAPQAEGLRIATAPGTVHEAFQLASGAVVLDILDAPALPMPASGPRAATSTPLRLDHLETYWRNRAIPAPARAEPTGAGAQRPGFAPSDPRVREAETELLAQLSRAASQGVISAFVAPKAEAPAPLPPDAAPPEGAAPHLAIESQTVFDRDMLGNGPAPQLLANGLRCLPDRLFAVESWVSDAPAGVQIATARQGLVGEFDRPDTAAVERLAHTYLGLGFGTEARATLRGFGLGTPSAGAIAYVAAVLDDLPVPDSPISRMAACHGKVALWALLGRDDAEGEAPNLAAVRRSFSALPLPIRKIVGPELVRRLLALGADSDAREIGSMLARGVAPGDPALGLIDARIDIARGEPAQAEPVLAGMIDRNSADAAQALVLLIDSRIARGEPVDAANIELATSLARELRGSPEGARLLRAQILGEGSVGRFSEAFAALDAWPAQDTPTLRQETRRSLWELLAKVPDDPLFLGQLLARQDQVPEDLPNLVRLRMADRLTAAGLTGPVRDLLGGPLGRTPDGRVALAAAAIAERDGPAALSYLDTLDGSRATALKARAHALLNEHAIAQAVFATAGDLPNATAEAWRGGDWSFVAANGSEAEKALVRLYDLTAEEPTAPPPSPADGVAGFKDLIARSQAEREALTRLLADFPNP